MSSAERRNADDAANLENDLNKLIGREPITLSAAQRGLLMRSIDEAVDVLNRAGAATKEVRLRQALGRSATDLTYARRSLAGAQG